MHPRPSPSLALSLVSPHHLLLDSSSSLLISLSAPSLSMLHFILHPVDRVMFLKQSSHLHSAPPPAQPIKKQTNKNLLDVWGYCLVGYFRFLKIWVISTFTLHFLTVSLKVLYIPRSLLPELALHFPIYTSLSPIWNASSTFPLLPVEIVTVLFSQFLSNGSFSMRFSCALPFLLVVFCLFCTALSKLCCHVLLLLPCYIIRP